MIGMHSSGSMRLSFREHVVVRAEEWASRTEVLSTATVVLHRPGLVTTTCAEQVWLRRPPGDQKDASCGPNTGDRQLEDGEEGNTLLGVLCCRCCEEKQRSHSSWQSLSLASAQNLPGRVLVSRSYLDRSVGNPKRRKLPSYYGER